MTTARFAELAERARALTADGRRRILGLAGPPGAGKSTLAERLAAELGPSQVALVGLDGFHIGDAELRRTGLRERKGAAETFDRAGYRALLQRLRTEQGIVYAPSFDRELEDSRSSAVPVPPDVPLVVTEGNYLLVWPEIRPLLDEVWYLQPADGARLAALTERHRAFGKSAEDAWAWAHGSDERNAELIARHRDGADLVIGWTAD